jgi:nitrogen fixation protein FixH
MDTHITTSEYMFRASVDFNKKLKDCTEQELESIKTKVLLNRKVRHELQKRYGY